jgi:polyhydroxyalkanoate synthase
VGAAPADVVHREGKWSLLRYRPAAGSAGPKHKTPVLLVPSLINRHYVLDLQPGKSFVEAMLEAGHDVWAIDWGRPTDEDRYLTLEDFADRALGRAVRIASRASGAGKANLLGYCLGGTLTAIHAALRPEQVASLTLVAAPVRFGDDGLLAAWTRTSGFDPSTLVAAFGNAPWPLMQAAFHMLRPTLVLAKLVHLLNKADDDAFVEGFLALETWGNDNVSFPGGAFVGLVRDLYRDDALARGTLSMAGRPVRLGDVRCPLLAITFEHDSIVPAASATAILELAGSKEKEHVHLPGGHVGAMVSRSAKDGLWPRISGFWAGRDGSRRGSTAPVPRRGRHAAS